MIFVVQDEMARRQPFPPFFSCPTLLFIDERGSGFLPIGYFFLGNVLPDQPFGLGVDLTLRLKALSSDSFRFQIP